MQQAHGMKLCRSYSWRPCPCTLAMHAGKWLTSAALHPQRRHCAADGLTHAARRAELVGRTQELQDTFKAWVITTGTTMVTDPQKDAKLIQGLLDLKESLDGILAGPFRSDPGFAKARFAHGFGKRARQTSGSQFSVIGVLPGTCACLHQVKPHCLACCPVSALAVTCSCVAHDHCCSARVSKRTSARRRCATRLRSSSTAATTGPQSSSRSTSTRGSRAAARAAALPRAMARSKASSSARSRSSASFRHARWLPACRPSACRPDSLVAGRDLSSHGAHGLCHVLRVLQSHWLR
jgi:hypothetical protein